MNDLPDNDSESGKSLNLFSKFAYSPSRKSRSSGTILKHPIGFERETKSDSSSLKKSTPKDVIERPLKLKKTRTYSHLADLKDYLAEGLEVLFCGINPGEQSAEIGHHYGNPTNHFWSCLHAAGFTSRRLYPTEDGLLPDHFSLGLTNLVSRPTAEQSELTKAEQIAGVSVFLDKVALWRPLVVCYVGLGIAEIVRSQTIAGTRATLGVQTYKMVHNSEDQRAACQTMFYAVASTSGRVVRYQKKDKIEQFKRLRAVLDQIKEGSFDDSGLVAIKLPSREEGLGGSTTPSNQAD